MYRIDFTSDAISDLRALRPFETRKILSEVDRQLRHTPDLPTRQRKHLRPNRLAGWELRVGEFRVFYDIIADDVVVLVVAIGTKTGGDLFVHGERYEL